MLAKKSFFSSKSSNKRSDLLVLALFLVLNSKSQVSLALLFSSTVSLVQLNSNYFVFYIRLLPLAYSVAIIISTLSCLFRYSLSVNFSHPESKWWTDSLNFLHNLHKLFVASLFLNLFHALFFHHSFLTMTILFRQC